MAKKTKTDDQRNLLVHLTTLEGKDMRVNPYFIWGMIKQDGFTELISISGTDKTYDVKETPDEIENKLREFIYGV